MKGGILACVECPLLDTPQCTPECRPLIIEDQEALDLSFLGIPIDDGCRWVASRPAAQ